MTDTEFLGVLALVALGFAVLGYVIGWCANPSDDHD